MHVAYFHIYIQKVTQKNNKNKEIERGREVTHG